MSVTKPWEKHQAVVKTYLEENGYDNFLREQTIVGTMFVGETDTTIREYTELVKNVNWDTCWKDAILDPGIGNPERFPLNSKTSGNYVHCAYHLAEYERIHKVSVKDLDFILEVGCGYGAMNRVCRQAGFEGEYILFDLPVFCGIQQEYLRARITDSYSCHNDRFISDVRLLSELIPTDKSMFISTWAVSEMPTDYRNRILAITPQFKEILLAYQCEFEGMDINGYFEEWQKTMLNHSWVNTTTIDTNHKYLFGHNFY